MEEIAHGRGMAHPGIGNVQIFQRQMIKLTEQLVHPVLLFGLADVVIEMVNRESNGLLDRGIVPGIASFRQQARNERIVVLDQCAVKIEENRGNHGELSSEIACSVVPSRHSSGWEGVAQNGERGYETRDSRKPRSARLGRHIPRPSAC